MMNEEKSMEQIMQKAAAVVESVSKEQQESVRSFLSGYMAALEQIANSKDRKGA